MVPYNYTGFLGDAKQLIAEKKVPMSRIDDAVTRTLRLKFQMGLFEKPYADKSLKNYVGALVSAIFVILIFVQEFLALVRMREFRSEGWCFLGVVYPGITAPKFFICQNQSLGSDFSLLAQLPIFCLPDPMRCA